MLKARKSNIEIITAADCTNGTTPRHCSSTKRSQTSNRTRHPPVTLTNIAQVDAAEFKPYLGQIGTFYKPLPRVERSGNEGTDNLHKRSRETDNSAGILDANLGPEKPLPATRKSSVPPLANIPAVYFNSHFHLENPRIFDAVTERSELVLPQQGTLAEEKVPANASGGAPRKALATNAILQEKISSYVDIVEMHLIAFISLASTSFSAALGSLQDIHIEVTNSVGRIKALRDKLHDLDQEIAVHGDIVQKRQ